MLARTDAGPRVEGFVEPGFEEVEAEFRRNFTGRGDLGGACAVYHAGGKVVDLWGGYRHAQTRAPWEENTLVVVFSTTKGMAAVTMAVAHSQGLFHLDEPVAAYWPEFAQNGKKRITVRQLFAHQAGLPALDETLTARKLADLDWLAGVLARQKPAWEPGTRHGYHALSLGWYQSALLRRVDPQQRSLGRFFQDEVATPLGLEFYIGLPAGIPAARVAKLESFHPLRLLLHLNTMPMGMVLSLMTPGSLTQRTMMNPRTRKPSDIDLPEFRAAEFPSAGGWGTARALAQVYGALATGGRELGLRPETWAALTAPAAPPSRGARDKVVKLDTAFAMGFMKPCATYWFGASDKAFGHAGAGGSFAFADPDRKLGFAYVTNKMGFYLFNDPREQALRDACYRCLRKLSRQGIAGP